MNLNQVIDQVGKDKGIEREVLIETLEAAILTAAKRTFGAQREIEAVYNEETGEVELFQIIQVAYDIVNPYREITIEEAISAGLDAEEGDELLFQIFYRPEDYEKAKAQDKQYGKILKLESHRSAFGRIAAQTAKQVIIQRVREAERDIIYNEFKDRKGEVITGIVRRFEKGALIVDVGRTEAILSVSEQTSRESYRPGDRIVAHVKNIQRSSREPQIVLSRIAPGLVIKLFEQEVPEIYEGVVQIMAIAREAGLRSKVAVYSRDSSVDPVGACVGMKGSRVQSIVQELRGEKIDIVPYHIDGARFVCHAISPAEVSKVLIDDANKGMELIVPDDQLSLAIGRGGQNVRLASQLTGWNLDIISETRLKQMMKEMKKTLMEYEGITEEAINTIFTLGYNKLEHIAASDIQELSQIPGFNAEIATRIVSAASMILARPKKDERPVTVGDLQKEILCEIRGVREFSAKKLHLAGYLEPLYIYYETDARRLDKRTGLGFRKSLQLIHSAQQYFRILGDPPPEVLEEHRTTWEEKLENLNPPGKEVEKVVKHLTGY